MIRPDKINEDGLPVLSWKENEDGLPILKKKESGVGGNVTGTLNGGGPKSGEGELFPLMYKREKGQMFADIRTPEQKAKAKVGTQPIAAGFTQVEKPKKDESFKIEITDKEAEEQAMQSFQNGEHTIEPDSKDPVGDLSKQINVKKYSYPDYKVARKKTELLNNNFFQSGDSAKEYLERELPNGVVMGGQFKKPDLDELPIEKVRELAGDNKTKQLAVQRYEKLRKVKESLDFGNRSIEDAAIYYAISEGNESAAYLVDKAGGTAGIPPSMKGEKTLQFVMNSEVQALAEKNPALKQDLNETIANFPNRNPEYATKLLAQAIANKRDEKKLNSSFTNIVSKETTDKIVNELIEEGTLPANYQFTYEKEIRPKLGTWQSIGRGIGNAIPGVNQLVNEAPIPTSGILENVEQGLENIQVGTAKSISGLLGITGAIQPKAQQVYNTLEKQYSTPSFEPSSLWQKATMHGGQMAGFVLGLGGGTKALSLIQSPKAAQATMMVLATHGDNKERAISLFPRNETKQVLFTATMDGLNAIMGPLLPGQQIPKLLGKGETTIAGALKAMVDGKITTDAAKSTILNWVSNTAKGTLGGAEFMGAIGAADDFMTQLLQQKGIDFSQTLEAGWEGAKVGALSTVFLAGAQAALKSNRGLKDEIISIAANPEHYKAIAESEAAKSPEFEKIKDDVIKNIDYIGKVFSETNLPPKEKQQFVINSLAEKIKLQSAEAATNPAIKKRLTDEAKKLNERQVGVLKGVPEEKIIENQAIKEVKEFYNEGFLSGNSMKMLETKKTEEGEPKFDENKVKDYLEFIAQQANNIGTDGKFVVETDVRNTTSKKFPSQLIELANDLFPEYKKLSEEADFETANKVNEPIELDPTLPEEYKLPEQPIVEAEVNIPKIEVNEQAKETAPIPIKAEEAPADIGTSEKTGEATSEGSGGKEPPKETVSELEESGIRLAHADTKEIYERHRLPGRLETPTKKDAELESAADKLVENGYDFDKEADRVMKGDKKSFTDEEQVAFAKMVGALEAKQEGLDIKSPEFNVLQDKIEKYSRASDIVGTLEARSFRSRQLFQSKDETKADFVMKEKEVAGVETLTDKQKETVQKDWDDINKAKEAFDKYTAQKEAELSEREAAIELSKITKEAKKSATKKDFATERKQIVGDIFLKLSKARGESASFLGAAELASIAPDVIRLVKNIAGEAAYKLSEVVDKVYDILKEGAPDIEKKHIQDIIGGVYTEKKKTRSQLAIRMMDFKIEVNLINKLQSLESGVEPKSDKKKIERNRQITELKKKIQPYTDLQAQKTKMANEIAEIKEQIRTGNFEKPVETKKTIPLDKEGVDLKHELVKLQQSRELRLLLQERQKESGGKTTLRIISEVSGVPRTLMTIADFSALLRQNIFFTAGHPIMTAQALPGMFRSFVSQKVYDLWFADLKEMPRYEGMKESRLAIADSLSHDLTKREEAFMSTFAEKLPLVGQSLKIKGKTVIPGLNIVKGSERSYTMLLNKMRVDMYNNLASAMENRGLTVQNSPKQYKAMAEYINNATGRSDFGETLNRVAPILNSVFFSARLIASRVNMLTYWAQPRFWKTLPREAKIDYFRGWISLLAVGGTILGLAKMGGADVEDDPRSADFGKIKSGNTRWDIWGGAQPYVRVLAQVGFGERKSTTTGETYKMKQKDRFLITPLNFLRNKLAPIPAAAIDLSSGETSIGEKIIYEWGADKEYKKIPIDQYIKERVLPMTITGTGEAMKDQGVKALFTVGLPNIFGVGTQTYDSSQKPTKKESGKKEGKKQSGKKQD